jgi:hypothetical protein
MTVSAGTVLSTFRLLGWLFPSRPIAELTDETFEELQQRFRSYDRWGVFGGIVGFVLLTFVYFILLVLVGRWLAGDLAEQRFLGPLEFLYFFAALFLSLFSTGAIMCLVYRLLLGARNYSIYMAYTGERNRPLLRGESMDFGKVYWLFFWIGVPPVIAMVGLYMDSFVAITDDTIVVNPFWTLGRDSITPIRT